MRFLLLLMLSTQAEPATEPGAAALAAPDEAGAAAASAPESEALAPPEEPAPTPPPGATALEAGLFFMNELELEPALLALNQATEMGPYTHDQLIALYTALGTVRAFFDDQEGAKEAFRFLLTIAPDATLSYKTSTKATFLFEAVREEAKNTRPPELVLVPPVLVSFDQPVKLTMSRRHDADNLFKTVAVQYRVQGHGQAFAELRVDAPPPGTRVEVSLPAVRPDLANVEEGGLSGAVVEVAVSAYDARGWEVSRSPSPSRPLEVPVGFDAPGPWYTSTWAIAGGMGGVAVVVALVTATAAAAGVAYFVAIQPPDFASIHVAQPPE